MFTVKKYPFRTTLPLFIFSKRCYTKTVTKIKDKKERVFIREHLLLTMRQCQAILQKPS